MRVMCESVLGLNLCTKPVCVFRSCVRVLLHFSSILYGLINNRISEPYCGDFCATYTNYFAFRYPGIGRAIVFLAFQGTFYLFCLFLLEFGVTKTFWQRVIESVKSAQNEVALDDTPITSRILQRTLSIEQDSDVIAEKEHIMNTGLEELHAQGNSLVLSEIRKFYGNLLAVDRLSVGITQGECFGLLGVNGAGKTTTFKMLTGDETVSSGDAFLDGYSVKNSIKEVCTIIKFYYISIK